MKCFVMNSTYYIILFHFFNKNIFFNTDVKGAPWPCPEALMAIKSRLLVLIFEKFRKKMAQDLIKLGREDAVTTKADPNKIDSNFILDELGGKKIITFKYQSPETGKVIDVSMVADPNTTRAQAHKLIAKYHKAMKQVRRNNNGIDPLWEGKKKKVKRNYQKEIGRKNRRGTNYQSILPSGKKKPVKALKLKSLMQKADEKRAERKGG